MNNVQIFTNLCICIYIYYIFLTFLTHAFKLLFTSRANKTSSASWTPLGGIEVDIDFLYVFIVIAWDLSFKEGYARFTTIYNLYIIDYVEDKTVFIVISRDLSFNEGYAQFTTIYNLYIIDYVEHCFYYYCNFNGPFIQRGICATYYDSLITFI